MEDRSDFAIERSEAAFVIADSFLVDPDVGAVVCRTDVEEGAGARFRLCIEVSLVPEDALVMKELGDLGVPVAGNLERRRGREVILFVVLSDEIGVLVPGV